MISSRFIILETEGDFTPSRQSNSTWLSGSKTPRRASPRCVFMWCKGATAALGGQINVWFLLHACLTDVNTDICWRRRTEHDVELCFIERGGVCPKKLLFYFEGDVWPLYISFFFFQVCERSVVAQGAVWSLINALVLLEEEEEDEEDRN